MNTRSREIKKALIDKGLTQTAVAKQLGLTLTTVNQVILGVRKSRRVSAYLNQILGIKEG